VGPRFGRATELVSARDTQTIRQNGGVRIVGARIVEATIDETPDRARRRYLQTEGGT
jgi:hypothetical protein